MARRILALVITVTFLCNLCGYYFIFLADQALYRHEMKSLIRAGKFSDQYETFVFHTLSDNKELKWIDAREFRFKGKLYDVVSLAREGAKITVTCINDNKEEKLISSYRQYAGHSSSEKSRQSRALSLLIVKQALVKSVGFPPASLQGRLLFSYLQCYYHSIPPASISPPPEFS